MAKSNYESDNSGNWNSAKEYSKEKIMNVLASLDRYEKLAQFGFSEPEEMFSDKKINILQVNYKKLIGFEFLTSGLLLLISNSDFAVTGDDKISNYEKVLFSIESDYSKIGKKISDNKARLSKNYYIWLKILRLIKKKLNDPLNKNSLIFKVVKELSLEEEIQKDEEEFTENP